MDHGSQILTCTDGCPTSAGSIFGLFLGSGSKDVMRFFLRRPGLFCACSACVGSFYQRFSLCEWPIKYDGNEHLSSIFFDEGWSAGSHLLQDCSALSHKGFVPTPLSSLR